MINYNKSDLENPSGHWKSQPWGSFSEYSLDKIVSENGNKTKLVRIKGSSENWQETLTLKNVEEIHLYLPTHQQISFISNLKGIKRLKIDSYRAKNIDFLSKLTDLEELSLEAVSGFEDLAPISVLSKLRALNLYILRRVKNFAALSSLQNLKFLRLGGNCDFPQPIENLEFFKSLKNLEYLIFDYARVLEKIHPAYAMGFLKNLKYMQIPRNTFSIEDFGYLAEALKGVEGADLKPVIKEIHFFHGNEAWTEYVPWQTPDEKVDYIDMHRPLSPAIKTPSEALLALGELTDIGEPSSKTGYLNLLGRGSRGFSSKIKNAEKRCLAHIEKFEQAKIAARQFLATIKEI